MLLLLRQYGGRIVKHLCLAHSAYVALLAADFEVDEPLRVLVYFALHGLLGCILLAFATLLANLLLQLCIL